MERCDSCGRFVLHARRVRGDPGGGEGWGSAWGARVGRKGDKGGGWTRTRRAWGNGLGHWQLGREIGMLRGTGTHLDAA